VIDRTEHDDRMQSKKSRETVDDDPQDQDGQESDATPERPEEAGARA
jgi:hypothetical protein